MVNVDNIKPAPKATSALKKNIIIDGDFSSASKSGRRQTKQRTCSEAQTCSECRRRRNYNSNITCVREDFADHANRSNTYSYDSRLQSPFRHDICFGIYLEYGKFDICKVYEQRKQQTQRYLGTYVDQKPKPRILSETRC